MQSSLMKFSNRRNTDNGDPLYWGRANEDGLPFRGPMAPLLRDEEMETRARKVADAKSGFFDVHVPEQKQAYLDIMECTYNGWYQLAYLERFWVDETGHRTSMHYVEWVEYYLEDSTMTHYAPQPVPSEIGYG